MAVVKVPSEYPCVGRQMLRGLVLLWMLRLVVLVVMLLHLSDGRRAPRLPCIFNDKRAPRP